MSDVKVEKDDHLARLTIDRPQRRNALSQQVVEDLTAAIQELGRDPQLRVIVLTGAGEKAFCAGGDLGDQAPGGGPLGMHRARGAFVELLLAMHRCPKPLIARVNGHALGGGLGLVLSCDLAIGADHATFGTPEVRVGLFPMMISAVIQRNLHRKHALELMLTGDRIDAHKAVSFGILNKAASRAELDDEVDRLVERVSSYSPAVLGLGRQAFYDTQDMSFEAALRALQSELTINTLTEDAAEGIMAFLGKRDPEWKGK